MDIILLGGDARAGDDQVGIFWACLSVFWEGF